MALAAYAKERLVATGLQQPFADRTTFKEFAVRVGRPATEIVREARARGVHPGYVVGRDYAGMDDVLLVAVTERRTPAEIERLAEVLEGVGAA
jgi:glycine dehydrogenase subunit 1